MDVSTLGYRPCVGIMVVNRLGHVWIGRRIIGRTAQEGGDFAQWWQMPQGGIDDGEDAEAAALRELAEETGMTAVTVLGRTHDWLTYDLPEALVPKTWGGKYRGQKQVWFALRFAGNDTEIDIGPKPGHAQEFDAWRWAEPDELLGLIVQFKRDVYARALREIGHHAKPA